MGNFNRDRGSRNGGRSGFGGRSPARRAYGSESFGSRGGYRRGRRDNKQMFTTVCSNCGKDCEVPFRPTGDKPVYCSDCFEKMGNRGERKSFDRPRFGERKVADNQYKAQFEALNAKLDKILKLLQPKPSVEQDLKAEVAPETPTEEKEVKPRKSRKVTKKMSPEENE